MRKVYLTILALLVWALTSTLFAEVIRTEYKQGINNTYKLEYTDRDKVFISNVVSPFEGIPRSLWREKIEITGFTGDMDQMGYNHIGPCVRFLNIDEDDNEKDMFFMSIDMGLDGIIRHITFAYSTKIRTIPLRVVEELETEIIQEHRSFLQYNPNNLEDVEYINIVRSYSLYYIKEEQLLKDSLILNDNLTPVN